MNIFHRKLRMLPIVALAIGATTTSLAAQVEDRPDSEQVSTLLSNVKTQAGMLREDASTMESYTRAGGLNWKSHAEAVNRMRDHINEAGRQLSKLQEVQAQSFALAKHGNYPDSAAAHRTGREYRKECDPVHQRQPWTPLHGAVQRLH